MDSGGQPEQAPAGGIYTGPVFEMARTQFLGIADHLGIPEDERDRLLYPKRGRGLFP